MTAFPAPEQLARDGQDPVIASSDLLAELIVARADELGLSREDARDWIWGVGAEALRVNRSRPARLMTSTRFVAVKLPNSAHRGVFAIVDRFHHGAEPHVVGRDMTIAGAWARADALNLEHDKRAAA